LSDPLENPLLEAAMHASMRNVIAEVVSARSKRRR
jgi:hypothetical protein